MFIPQLGYKLTKRDQSVCVSQNTSKESLIMHAHKKMRGGGMQRRGRESEAEMRRRIM